MALVPSTTLNQRTEGKFSGSTKHTYDIERETMKRTKFNIKPGNRCPAINEAIRFTKAFNLAILAAIAFMLATYCSMIATSLKSPLGLVSPSHAILILHVLAKFSDFVTGLAISSMWSSFQWAEVFSETGLSFLACLTLDASTEALGLWKILLTRATIPKSVRFWSILR